MKLQSPIYFHETEIFREWLKSKGYTWPSDPIEQENIIVEHLREALEKPAGGRRPNRGLEISGNRCDTGDALHVQIQK